MDKNAVYSQVLSITGYEKNLIGQYTKETDYTIYTYGIGLISQESGRKGEEGTEENANTAGGTGSAAAETAGTAYYLYHYNQAGSTTQVTDETGNIIYRYAYSPYGERMGTYDGEGNRISDDTPIRFLYNGQSLNKYSYVQGNPVTLTDPFGLCPVGSSMNDYLALLGHTALDLLGFLPIVGFAADLANAYWYYREGNTFQMASSIIVAIPGLGDAVGGIIKGAGFVAKCEKAVKVVKAVSITCRMAGAVAQTGVNIINFDKAFQSVTKEYKETGHVSFLNGANVALSALGVIGRLAQSVSSRASQQH